MARLAANTTLGLAFPFTDPTHPRRVARTKRSHFLCEWVCKLLEPFKKIVEEECSGDAKCELPQLLRHRGRRLVLLLRRNHRVVGYGVPYRYVLIDAMCADLIPNIYGMKIYRR